MTWDVRTSPAAMRLAQRLEKRAVDLGEVLKETLSGAAYGAVPSALFNAIGSANKGWPVIAQQGLIGAITGALPGALYSGITSYQDQLTRDEMLEAAAEAAARQYSVSEPR